MAAIIIICVGLIKQELQGLKNLPSQFVREQDHDATNSICSHANLEIKVKHREVSDGYHTPQVVERWGKQVILCS